MRQGLPPVLLIRHTYDVASAEMINITPDTKLHVYVITISVRIAGLSMTFGVRTADRDHKQ